MPTRSLLNIYDSYIKKLRTMRRELAMLQLTGKLEDRLAKEFASCVYRSSGRSLVALSNVGKKGEQKVDLAVLEGDFSRALSEKTLRFGHSLKLSIFAMLTSSAWETRKMSFEERSRI